ncbi:MAG: hypothetical protein ABR920_14835 [Terriglobales bacterium]
MPLAIVDCGTKIRRPGIRRLTSGGPEISASFCATALVTSSAKRPLAAMGAAVTYFASTAAIRASAAMKTAASATMKTSASTAMETAATTAVTAAATVLSECCIWRESKTDENSKCDEGSENTESAHNPYLRSKQRTFERGAHGEGRRAPT